MEFSFLELDSRVRGNGVSIMECSTNIPHYEGYNGGVKFPYTQK